MTESSSEVFAGLRPAGGNHPRVRQYLAIKNNRAPRPATALVLEGLWAVRAAVDSGLAVEVVFVCRALLRGDAVAELFARLGCGTWKGTGARHGPVLCEVSERVLHRMVEREGPDGVAAIAHLPSPSLADVPVTARTRLLVADAVDLAGNLGTLIRCADGAGATAVVVTDRRVRLTHPLVVKASMGTLFSVPVVEARREVVLAWARARRFTIVGADPGSETSYRRVAWKGPVAIVVGSERQGLSPFWRDHADTLVSIPMLGRADSLNVGHAAALLLYEALHALEQ